MNWLDYLHNVSLNLRIVLFRGTMIFRVTLILYFFLNREISESKVSYFNLFWRTDNNIDAA